MAETPAPEQVFEFVGGELCLDFANTLGGERTDPKERLLTYQDLVTWGRQAGLLNEEEARRLAWFATMHPNEAARVLRDAIGLREAMFRIFASALEGAPAPDGDLKLLNDALARTQCNLRVVSRGPGFEWTWCDKVEPLDRMLWPVVRSATDLLVSDHLGQVHRCSGERCDWLFLDSSRNHSRRWCTMRDCGNRAKARRFHARKKASA
jgi:predicted RNA-binding Zn ribbon-like protein